MKALEAGGNVDSQGNLSLDKPVPGIAHQRVRVIILVQDDSEESEFDPNDPPVDATKESLQRALHQGKVRQTIPLSQMWDEIDAE